MEKRVKTSPKSVNDCSAHKMAKCKGLPLSFALLLSFGAHHLLLAEDYKSADWPVRPLFLDFPLQLDPVTVELFNKESKEKWQGLSLSTRYRRISVILGSGVAGCDGMFFFLGAPKHLYNWLCPSVGL